MKQELKKNGADVAYEKVATTDQSQLDSVAE